MTASERAALLEEIAALARRYVREDPERPGDLIWGTHLSADGDEETGMTPRDFAVAMHDLLGLLSSPPPASDERPSEDETVIRCEGFLFPDGESRCTRFKDHKGACRFGDDEASALWNGMTYWYRVAQDLRAAAAPAPDEGPDEKKLTSYASLTVREPPDQGPMPTGCDGEGSLWALRNWLRGHALDALGPEARAVLGEAERRLTASIEATEPPPLRCGHGAQGERVVVFRECLCGDSTKVVLSDSTTDAPAEPDEVLAAPATALCSPAILKDGHGMPSAWCLAHGRLMRECETTKGGGCGYVSPIDGRRCTLPLAHGAHRLGECEAAKETP